MSRPMRVTYHPSQPRRKPAAPRLLSTFELLIGFGFGVAMGLALATLAFVLTVASVHAAESDALLGFVNPDPAPVVEVAAPTISEIVCSYQWGPSGCPGALRVMNCESSGDQTAWDGYNAGLFQVAPRFHEWRLKRDLGEYSLFDPYANIRVAHEIYAEQGRGPWPVCGRWF